MKVIVAVLLLAAACEDCLSQVTADDRNARPVRQNVFGIGLTAGLASGFGLSFRQHLPGDFSYQVVGGIIKLGEKLDYNAGGELQFDFARGISSRFYGAAASGYFYSGEAGANSLAAPFRAGLGVGGEWSNSGPLNLAAELLFTYFSDGTIIPLPQVAAHYYFF